MDRNLTIQRCERLSGKRQAAHDDLEVRLFKLTNEAVVAMDFPFSVPQAFADALADAEREKRASDMSEIWSIVAKEGLSFRRFQELRDSFVKCHGETMRRGDVNFAGPFSPLHDVRPSMLQMTFYGMKMLYQLRQSGFRVPPLSDDKCKGPKLLETMPGVLLRTFCLPAQNYKNPNKSNGGDPKRVRRQILDGLIARSDVSLEIADQFQENCIRDDNCLDSLVAAIGAAMWAMDKSQFLHPRESISQKEEIQAAQLEGWIYAPKPTKQ